MTIQKKFLYHQKRSICGKNLTKINLCQIKQEKKILKHNTIINWTKVCICLKYSNSFFYFFDLQYPYVSSYYTIMELFLFILSVSINIIRVYVRVWLKKWYYQNFHEKGFGLLLMDAISMNEQKKSILIVIFCIFFQKFLI